MSPRPFNRDKLKLNCHITAQCNRLHSQSQKSKWTHPTNYIFLHLHCKRATRRDKTKRECQSITPRARRIHIRNRRSALAVVYSVVSVLVLSQVVFVFLLRYSNGSLIEVVLGQCDPHSCVIPLLFETAGSWNCQVSPGSVFIEWGLHLRVIVRLVSNHVVVFDVSAGLFHRFIVRSCKFLLGFFENILVPSSECFPPVIPVCHGYNS